MGQCLTYKKAWTSILSIILAVNYAYCMSASFSPKFTQPYQYTYRNAQEHQMSDVYFLVSDMMNISSQTSELMETRQNIKNNSGVKYIPFLLLLGDSRFSISTRNLLLKTASVCLFIITIGLHILWYIQRQDGRKRVLLILN